MGHLNDIQTALKPFKKIIKYIYKTILGPAASFKTMNQAGPAWP